MITTPLIRKTPRLVAAIAGITLLGACSSISQQQEVEMGAQEAQQVNAQLPMLNDATINAYVNSLGRSIAGTTSRADLNWQFAVVNTDVINAFALPGGYIYVNRGVLSRERQGRGYVYEARVSEDVYLAHAISRTLASASDEARHVALARLIGELEPRELSKVQRLARESRRRRSK